MSFLDFLSPALTAATGAAGTYENAEANAQTLKRENLIQAMMLARQARLDRIDMALKGAQTTEATGRGNEAQRAADAAHLGDPNYASAMGAVKGAESSAALPFELELQVQQGKISRANALAEVAARGGIDTNIANIGQAGQNTRQQSLFGQQKALQLSELAGTHANKTAETAQTQAGSLIPHLLHPINWLKGQPLTGSAPTSPLGSFDGLPNSGQP